MNMHLRKVGVLSRKDIKDALKNGNMLILAILPVAMTLLYRFMNLDGMQMDPAFVLSLGLLMTLTLVPLTTTSMMIAEEKEKNTLRTLMLSNVSAGEFLLSKTFVNFLIMMVASLLIFLITGTSAVSLPKYILVVALSSLNMILFGALIGIISPNQMSTGMIAAPVALVMLIPAIFAQVSESFASAARFLPSYAMIQLLFQPDGGILFPVAVLLLWTALAAVLFWIVFQKKRLD